MVEAAQFNSRCVSIYWRGSTFGTIRINRRNRRHDIDPSWHITVRDLLLYEAEKQRGYLVDGCRWE